MGIVDIDWRGPRPLQPGDELIGRRRERQELRSRCETYDVVQVTAPSGVGKTSFVSAGGIPALKEAGYHVPPLRSWSELHAHRALSGEESAERYAQILYRLILGLDGKWLDPETSTLTDAVAEAAAGGQMVVVIDQTEELLRYQGAVGRALLRIAGEAALASHVPHVVIARSEYREGLRPVEVRGAKVWNLFLDEITSEKALAEIVAKPAREAGVDFHEDAIAQVIQWWSTAKAANISTHGSGSELVGGVGLLHLQSLLWSLKAWATGNDLPDAIMIGDLQRFAQTRADARGFSLEDGELVGARLIEDAIVSYVQEQIEQATIHPTVTRDGTERALRWNNGPRLLLARFAPALSSGGYKVAQALTSLVPLAFGEELTQQPARELAELIRRGGDLGTWAEEIEPLTGAGIAAGWTQTEMVCEMVDALESILQALSAESANILRVYNVTEEPVYELVHDGVGPALTKWAQAFLDQPVSAVGVIAAQPGGAFGHTLAPEVFLDARGQTEPQWGTVAVIDDDAGPRAVIDGLRWASNFVGKAGGRLRLPLRDITLRDCDFTGAAFVACDFSGVVFERCTFKGAVMIACTMDGVRFIPAEGRGEDLNLLTIKTSTAVSPVRFEGLTGTTGLVFEDLKGGTWEFYDCSDLKHVVVASGAERTLVRMVNTEARHVTVAAPVRIELDASVLVYEELG